MCLVWVTTAIFVALKHRLCLTPILSLLDLQQPFKIEIDASDCAVGAILTQHGHPMAYHSETLSDAVHKYPTYDKEVYFIVQAYWKMEALHSQRGDGHPHWSQVVVVHTNIGKITEWPPSKVVHIFVTAPPQHQIQERQHQPGCQFPQLASSHDINHSSQLL